MILFSVQKKKKILTEPNKCNMLIDLYIELCNLKKKELCNLNIHRCLNISFS